MKNKWPTAGRIRMSNIWFTSDTHFHHNNIVRGCTNWVNDPTKGAASVQRTRDFKTLEEHDETLVKNINNCVKPDDILYALGDWSFGGLEQVWEFRKRLHCKNIHLIFGNHDHHLERNRALPNAHTQWTEETGIIVVDGACPPTTGTDKGYIRPATTQELFKSTQYYSRRVIGGQDMVLSHYAMRTWDKGHKGTWMLFGHSHGTLGPYGGYVEGANGVTVPWEYKTMDVGIDTHPEFRPYHIEEIGEIMKNRVDLKVDHHNEATN
jgi:calcineurin-like phosphoesterase family protein